jgi:hypothetical protein
MPNEELIVVGCADRLVHCVLGGIDVHGRADIVYIQKSNVTGHTRTNSVRLLISS